MLDSGFSENYLLLTVFAWYLDGIVIENINQNNGGEGDEAIIFVESQNGKRKACHRGYYYNMHKEIKRTRDGTMRFQCEFVTSQRCPGYIWVHDGRATRVGETGHTHGPNPARVHHLQVRIIYTIYIFHTFHFMYPYMYLNYLYYSTF